MQPHDGVLAFLPEGCKMFFSSIVGLPFLLVGGAGYCVCDPLVPAVPSFISHAGETVYMITLMCQQFPRYQVFFFSFYLFLFVDIKLKTFFYCKISTHSKAIGHIFSKLIYRRHQVSRNITSLIITVLFVCMNLLLVKYILS